MIESHFSVGVHVSVAWSEGELMDAPVRQVVLWYIIFRKAFKSFPAYFSRLVVGDE